MTKLNVSNVAAKTGLDALLDLLDSGGAGKLRIYAGTAPVDTDTALSSNTLLADFALNATGFANSADLAPGARATANSISDVTASNTGTATFGRLLNNAALAVAQFDVGTASATCIVPTTSFVSGQTCSVTSATITLPEGDTF